MFLDNIDIIIKDEGPYHILHLRSNDSREWAKSYGLDDGEPLTSNQYQQVLSELDNTELKYLLF